jgi:transcriptional regulator with XRE-family HTH domain
MQFIDRLRRRPNAAKQLAREAAVSPRTAEAWLGGRRDPAIEALVRLMAAHPDLERQIRQDIETLRRVTLRAEATQRIVDESAELVAASARSCAAARGVDAADARGMAARPGGPDADNRHPMAGSLLSGGPA